MDADPPAHPTDQTLRSYGLGTLESGSAEAIHAHLEACPDCRKRVAELSADSFLGRARDAQGPPGKSTVGLSRVDAAKGPEGDDVPIPPRADTIPPGLAEHPDYEIKRELGRGGMGVVYLAHNTLMGRDEVLKVLGRQVLDRPGMVDRFVREIRAVARLRHPNIVSAYSAMRVGEGIVFAMEYVDGLDLSRLVRSKGPLPVAHACLFAHQAALGLQCAHEEGLVHRDIKPANLMLTKKGGKAIVKVLDFGLARATREEKVDGGLTSEGQALGTPDFIAPEQILNAPGADIRADIYSLGGTLYYLLTGHPPFLGDCLYDIYQAHISRDAEPLNLVRPEVPSELAALVAKMMAKEPSGRFQTPGEVAQALLPFFKKMAPGAKVEFTLSQPSSSAPEKAPIEPRPATPRPRARKSEAAAAPTPPEGLWEGLIDVGQAERPEALLRPVKRTAPAGRPATPRWLLPTSAAGLAAVALLVAVGFAFRPSPKAADGVRDAPPARPIAPAPKTEPIREPVVEEQVRPTPRPSVVATVDPSPKASVPKPDETPKRPTAKLSTQEELAAVLEMRVPMSFPRGTSLGELVKHITKATSGPNYAGIPIYVDPFGLQEAEKSMDSMITIDIQGRPLSQSLRLALRGLGLDYRPSEGLLIISDAGGGPIAQPAVRIEIKADRDADSKKILAALEQPIPMRYPEKTKLGDVVDAIKASLKDASGAPIQIWVDPDGLHEAEKSLDSPVAIDMEGVPLRITLHWLLHQIGMSYYVKQGVLTITDWGSIPPEL